MLLYDRQQASKTMMLNCRFVAPSMPGALQSGRRIQFIGERLFFMTYHPCCSLMPEVARQLASWHPGFTRTALPAGDSFAAGYANLGGSDSCNFTACTVYGCLPELDSQDATKAWGPMAALGLDADYELLAWSGSGVVTYFVPEAIPESDPEYSALPKWVQEAQYPLDIDLFARQVAGDNTSIISNYSSWVPQVSSTRVAH